MADSFSPQTTSPPVLGAGGPVWDEMSDPRGQIRPHWFSMGQKIQLWSTEERGSIAAAAARMIADLGRLSWMFPVICRRERMAWRVTLTRRSD